MQTRFAGSLGLLAFGAQGLDAWPRNACRSQTNDRIRWLDRDGLSRKVLLIGWDAADWEHITPLLEEGLMPTLDAVIDRGAMGNLATLQPILSRCSGIRSRPVNSRISMASMGLSSRTLSMAEPALIPARRESVRHFGIFSVKVGCEVMSSAGGQVIRRSRSMAR